MPGKGEFSMGAGDAHQPGGGESGGSFSGNGGRDGIRPADPTWRSPEAAEGASSAVPRRPVSPGRMMPGDENRAKEPRDTTQDNPHTPSGENRPLTPITFNTISRHIIRETSAAASLELKARHTMQFPHEDPDLPIGRTAHRATTDNGVSTQVGMNSYNEVSGTQRSADYLYEKFFKVLGFSERAGFVISQISLKLRTDIRDAEASPDPSAAAVLVFLTSKGEVRYAGEVKKGEQHTDIEEQLDQWGLPIKMDHPDPGDQRPFSMDHLQAGTLDEAQGAKFSQALRIFLADANKPAPPPESS